MTQFSLPLDIELLEITKQYIDNQGSIISDNLNKIDILAKKGY